MCRAPSPSACACVRSMCSPPTKMAWTKRTIPLYSTVPANWDACYSLMTDLSELVGTAVQ